MIGKILQRFFLTPRISYIAPDLKAKGHHLFEPSPGRFFVAPPPPPLSGLKSSRDTASKT